MDMSTITSWLASNLNIIVDNAIASLIATIIFAWIYSTISYIKLAAKKASLRTVFGIFVVFVEISIVMFGAYMWGSTFQISKVTNPSFIWNSILASIEMIILYIGILLIIVGDLIINKVKTLQMMRKLNERLNASK